MSRLPLSYYRRKWAFEKARKLGLLYYTYFCACDFVKELIPKPVAMILDIITNLLRFVIRCMWYIINGIFPNPEGFANTRGVWTGSSLYLQGERDNVKEYMRQKRSSHDQSHRSRESVWHNETAQSAPFIIKLGKLIAKMITPGYYSNGDVQNRQTLITRLKDLDHDDFDEHKGQVHSSFSSVHDLTHNLQRRVRTRSYEYSEDRGREFGYEPIRTVKPSKGLLRALMGKLFYLTSQTYDLRSRTVYKNLSPDESLPYTDRLANFMSELVVSCFFNVSSVVVKVLFLPFTMLFFIAGRIFGSNRAEQSLQKNVGTAVQRTDSSECWLPDRIFHFMISHLYSWAMKSVSVFIFLQSLPFFMAESVRERAAYALFNIEKLEKKADFPSGKALEEYFSIAYIAFQKKVTSAFIHRAGEDDMIVNVVNSYGKIETNLFDEAGWTQKLEHNLNIMSRNVLHFPTLIYSFLRDLLLWPTKLYAVMHAQEAVQQVVRLPNYVYYAGQSLGSKAVANACSHNFLSRIPGQLYVFGELVVVHFLKSINSLGSTVCDVVRQMLAVSEWMWIDRVFEIILDIILFVWKLVSSTIQIVLASPSHFISRIADFIPFMYRKTELLELKVSQLRRESELEENRYKGIHEAFRLIEKNAPLSTDKQLQKSSVFNGELFQFRTDEDFVSYMSDVRKIENEELRKRLLDIEKRLMERLDVLSGKIEDKIVQKVTTHTSQQSDIGRLTLSNELSELSSAVANLRSQFDELRMEKESKITQFAHSIISDDLKRSDDLNMLKTELNKIKNDLEKELSFTLSRFEKASHEERETFRFEVMKTVENRIIALFANHITEKNDIHSKAKLSSLLGLSESDFVAIKKMIADALDIYDADKTGKVDYALESSGASVISTRCTEPYKENSRLESVFGIPLWYSSYSPRAVIQHRPLAAGECWAFRGKGYLTIKLSHLIYVTESYKAVDDLKSKSLIGQYEYDIKGRALQTFRVQIEPKTPVSIIELVVESNWDSDYTCLYRFRVHGRKA
uniref:SUN domain-containing protein n=1 Tax=Setaria digitata TaxID=48799 RepID=A0A915Q0A5_9BILA